MYQRTPVFCIYLKIKPTHNRPYKVCLDLSGPWLTNQLSLSAAFPSNCPPKIHYQSHKPAFSPWNTGCSLLCPGLSPLAHLPHALCQQLPPLCPSPDSLLSFHSSACISETRILRDTISHSLLSLPFFVLMRQIDFRLFDKEQIGQDFKLVEMP